MGCRIARDFWGKGIGSTALDKFINYIFSKGPIVGLFASVAPENRASIRVLEKSG
ncbi:GNAT family N-acetyltransferase [Microbulbifer sp. MLAF003]|uniref:GNAT family N-acetyltransferase n=1 Tax=Microbulbifer sp. MLAF003 TaxID=3032582 RepID=UPI00333FA787